MTSERVRSKLAKIAHVCTRFEVGKPSRCSKAAVMEGLKDALGL